VASLTRWCSRVASRRSRQSCLRPSGLPVPLASASACIPAGPIPSGWQRCCPGSTGLASTSKPPSMSMPASPAFRAVEGRRLPACASWLPAAWPSRFARQCIRLFWTTRRCHACATISPVWASEITRFRRFTTSPGWQGRCQLGLDVGVEGLAVHGLIDHPRRDEAIVAQAGDEGLRGPVSERRPGLQAGTAARAAAQTRHLGRRAGLVEEDQTVDLLTHERLALPLPVVTRLTHVLAPGFRRQQCFF
jgi:hypothetical protein